MDNESTRRIIFCWELLADGQRIHPRNICVSAGNYKLMDEESLPVKIKIRKKLFLKLRYENVIKMKNKPEPTLLQYKLHIY
jgi:hypothetical protein